ncbi:MAG: DUF1772 domain-containing protein [Bacteroidota bacterium]
MKNTLLFLSICIASGLLLANVYNSLIDAKSWGSDIPNSISTAREYFKAVNPGNFYRIFSPVNQFVGLVVLILFWKASPSIRWCLGIAFGLYVLSDVFTFAYFYPRNEIMFKTTQLTDVETLKKVWAEWNTMNWVRSLMMLIGLFFSFLSLHKIYTLK